MNPKTFMPRTNEIKRQWHLIDASGVTLGRLSTRITDLLRGKGKPIYTPHVDCGDFVIVTNVKKIVLTGKKLDQKMDFRHTLYPGGARFTQYSKLMAEKPERVIRLAVMGMLPANKLADRQIKRLKIYSGDTHPHSAQVISKKANG
jgi:large subunit ribosomal protein L13